MARIDRSLFDIGAMDELARQDSALHRLDPRAKLLTTLVFIVTVVSFDKYTIAPLVPFFIYPVVLCALGDLPPALLMKRVLLVAPFAVLIGIFNPLMDRAVLTHIGSVPITGGWVSFASIVLRVLLTVGAALLLVALTGFNAVCAALEKLGVPRVFVVQLMFLYRYLFVLVDEAARMVRARALRSFRPKAAGGLRVFGSMVGHLLLRTMDRAQRIHLAMRCRGFDGSMPFMAPLHIGPRDVAFCAGWSALFIVLRMVSLPRLLGRFLMGILP